MLKVKATFSVFFLVALVGLIVLSACQSAEAAKPEASDFSYEQVNDHMSERWQAMGRAYEKAAQLELGLNPDDISSQRWNALAASYERLAARDDAMVLRWEAMGRFYEQNGLFTGDSELTVAVQD